MPEKMTWEDAVRWYRAQPNNQEAIQANYFDLPVYQAVKRYEASEEFAEVLRLLGAGRGRTCLDVGAGNGIASYALAKNGWDVTALEPDPSDEVGHGAIRAVAAAANLPIRVLSEWGEQIPIDTGSQDAVHVRQVLHHARDLREMLKEIARVLKPGGVLLATREHVVDDENQLAAFRSNHPLHGLYGGENAFRLDQYQEAIRAAGLTLVDYFGPVSSILNFAPGTEKQRMEFVRHFASVRWRGCGRFLVGSKWFLREQARVADRANNTPGRIYSFIAKKPGSAI